MYQKLNYYADFLSNAAQYDTYRTLDYGFSFDDFYKAMGAILKVRM